MGDLRNTSAGLVRSKENKSIKIHSTTHRHRTLVFVHCAQDFAVTLDAVGGTMIYARAEVFQKGVVFPTELVNHQVWAW